MAIEPMSTDIEYYVTDYNGYYMPKGTKINVHTPDACEGENCAIHNPSDHALCDEPMVFRADKHFLIERLCEHGVGHPDPDSLWYYQHKLEMDRFNSLGVHGCDGCCFSRRKELEEDDNT